MNNQTRRFYSNRLLLVFSGILLCFLTVGLTSANGNTNVNRTPVADFDGDGKTDISVYRLSNNYWYISKSSGGYLFVQWGQSGDVPVPGDYDGDGKTDIAVYREFRGVAPAEGVDTTWYILRSSDFTFYAQQWGRDTPYQRNAAVPADYDGDGKTDLAVYTLSDAVGGSGDFQILQSSTNTGIIRQWGYNTDKRVPSDYDGDGKADIAVVSNGVWYILQSSNNELRTEYFGLSTDGAVPADYDGDGKADIAVWRPSNAIWYIQQSARGFRAEQFGLSMGDVLLPNFSVR